MGGVWERKVETQAGGKDGNGRVRHWEGKNGGRHEEEEKLT